MNPTMWTAAVLSAVAVAVAIPGRPRGAPARAASRSPEAPSPDRPPAWRWPAVVVVGLVVAVMVGGAVGMVVGPAASVVAHRLIWRMEPASRRRRRERLASGLPHVVDLMAACLSAGASPMAAVERVARSAEDPMREELNAISSRLAMGVDPVRVWRDLGRHPELGPLGRCIARAAESGASVSEAMHRLAEDQRRATRAEVESRARAVGVKAAVPLGVCLLPAFILVGVVPLVVGSLSNFLSP